MATYNSLLDFLDAQLPWSFTISLQNFFAIFGFSSRVPDEITSLREQVDEALSNNRERKYLHSYDKLSEETLKKFDISGARKHLSQKEIGYLNLFNLITKPIETAKESLPPKIKPQENPLLSSVLSMGNKPGWQDKILESKKDISKEDQLKLAKDLIYKANNTRHDPNLRNIAFYYIKTLDMPLKGIQQQIFNDLQNEDDVACFHFYLTALSSEFYRAQIQKGKKQFEDFYGATSKEAVKLKSSFKPFLHPDFGNAQLLDFTNPLIKLEEKLNAMAGNTDSNIIISEILNAINKLKEIVILLQENEKLLGFELKEHKRTQKEIDNDLARVKFNIALRNGNVRQVYEADLERWYGKGTTIFELTKKMIKKKGITVIASQPESDENVKIGFKKL